MSIPPSSPGRGCASSFSQPVTDQDRHEAQIMANNVRQVNCEGTVPRLTNITYRNGTSNSDITRRLFRWDRRSYEDIFQNGFRAIPNPDSDPITRYDLLLHDYVNGAGPPLGLDRPRRHVFLSTTLDSNWFPCPNVNILPGGGEMVVYRYEIYAPGGIWVAATLRDQYRYPSQDEVCFVDGIAPQYIRSAQAFTITRPAYRPPTRPPRPNRRRVDTTLTLNRHFNPSSDPTMDLIRIQRPIHYYLNENDRRRRMLLHHETYPPPPSGLQKRQVSNYDFDVALKWYGNDVADVSSYIDAAFRSSRANEAYIFMKNEYVLLNYAPHSTGDYIVNGPLHICDGFPSLIATPFGEYGIDCAFDTHNNEAFIFSTNLCAYIDYAPGTTNDKILKGPMTIASMFPFAKGTVFEDGVDAAFRSTMSKEVYLFKGDTYALINYNSMNLIHIQKITDGFPCLIGTIFAISGIDAAFASNSRNEAYIFKGEYYALINFAPHLKGDKID